MTLPTGSINFNNINVEIKRPGTQALSLNDGTVRQVAGKTSGAIDMNSLRGKSYWTITQSRSSTTSIDRITLTSNITCTWSYSVSHGGTGTFGASPANGGSSTTGAYSLTGAKSGSAIQNDTATVSITANLNGATMGFSYTLNVGNQ